MANQEQLSHYQQKLQYEIDAWDLHQSLEHGENIVILDVRSVNAYQIEHIPHAVNFPHRNINKDSAAERLNLNTLYITYCDGIGCNASTKGALKLTQLGYKVKELIGGIDWWKRDGYSTQSINHSDNKESSDCGCSG